MAKTLVTPNVFIELVNKAIKQHPEYSEDRPIEMIGFYFYHFIFNIPQPVNKLDNQILKDALATVQETYSFKDESSLNES